MKDKKIKSALISVFDKEGLEPIVTKLYENGVIIYSTSENFKYFKEIGITTQSIDDVTKCDPDFLEGRLKLIQPKVFGGILNKSNSKTDKIDVKNYGLPKFDLVIVELPPFDNDSNNIDIEGISIIRAAAKNHKDVLIISDRSQYQLLEQIIDEGLTTTEVERETFAIDAFNLTSNYDNDVFKYLLDNSDELNEDSYLNNDDNQSNSGINLNIDKDDYHLNDYLVCWEKFGHRPNRILIHNTYSGKLFDEVITKYVIEKNVFTEVIPDTEELIINDKLFIKLDEGCYISYIVADRLSESSFIDSISFYYANGYDKVQDFIDELNECVLDYEEDDSNKLNTIGLSINGLEIEPISLHNIDLDNVDNYYNSDTFRRVEKAVKQIKKSDKGLTVLYGERGSGKTSIINYISSKLDRIVIFIPNNMIDHTINNPEFRKFIKKYDKPVLVLDDCEIAFTENYGRSNMFTNNLLQMVDGFLSDSINCNIVTIFNISDEEEIDQSLLECNNIIDVIEFDMLTSDESNVLAKHISSNKKYKNKTKLIDIIKKRSNKQEFEIGF